MNMNKLFVLVVASGIVGDAFCKNITIGINNASPYLVGAAVPSSVTIGPGRETFTFNSDFMSSVSSLQMAHCGGTWMTCTGKTIAAQNGNYTVACTNQQGTTTDNTNCCTACSVS